ncbi:hypothetical protein HNY73_016734 [Argiope bruennichi]|uniref:Uncharacterized protein n=1 Tax=Argiope bruennichi TaxID=94029 RepID=A0A8T0EJP4_ARGBR|nr:hypothetical protein HNY73_016734 [Argiope bruennichi]
MKNPTSLQIKLIDRYRLDYNVCKDSNLPHKRAAKESSSSSNQMSYSNPSTKQESMFRSEAHVSAPVGRSLCISISSSKWKLLSHPLSIRDAFLLIFSFTRSGKIIQKGW